MPMADLRRTWVLCITLGLIAGCSTIRAADGKQGADNPTNTSPKGSESPGKGYRVPTAELIKAINSTNSALEGSCDFGISDIFGALIARADLAFESVGNGNEINLKEPRRVQWMPIAELDRMLTNGAVQKELAVAVISFPWPGPHDAQPVTNGEFIIFSDPKWKSPEKFAFEIDQKLRGAGFKYVIFSCKNTHGFYERMWLTTQRP